MCGIAGELKFGKDAQVDAGVLRQMCDAMIHRGPDDEGLYVRGSAGLGMRRLSIIDLATGHQPISNEDGTIWIVFNGEIYNHRSLREQLILGGHRYATHSDTETIVHLYEEYGRDCVQHLRGMFAFALWDTRRRSLFVARDRLGIKPLYYRATPDSFLFGSEIKVILAYPGVKPEFNQAALPEYLAFGYLSGQDTFYRGIRKLMPGHVLEVNESGEVRIERYWDLPCTGEETPRSEDYYIESYRELLEQAVESHLMSDVPLGVFLSGGLDSSAVAALMTKIRRAPIETFSVGYAEHKYSELPYARMVADHIGSVHREVLVSAEEFFDTLPKLIWHEDEPITWPSSVSLYFVSRLASEHVKVVLTGEGSDETLAGYTRYAFTLNNAALDRAYRTILPSSARRKLRQLVASSPLIHAHVRRKLEHTFVARDGDSWPSFYLDNFLCAFSAAEQTELLSHEVVGALKDQSPYENALEQWENASGPMLQRLLYTDIKTYLVELLMKQDNMSMATSIESRVPFLDHVLAEFAANIPQSVQIKGLSGKRILKKAVKDLLPGEILYRPKLGFPTPWSGWLAGPRLDEIEKLLLEQRSLSRQLFKSSAIERLFREHRNHYRDNYDRIWRLLNLEVWHRVCIEGEPHDGAVTNEVKLVPTA
ncbi:MAG TPA: asparagine synthase (glutamine-hydrolyzing) [Terriglobales bacterium]|nr:asparagine synthase (glutamine-hydrolyzing) [Terriglobales bacterium]HUK49330.1 asparagine synthase (glutamine-hydrolyzing) [Terriglobales bacterium]